MCSHSLLSRNFLTQGLNLGLLYCRQILYHLRHYLLINLVANIRFSSFYFMVRTSDLVNKLSNSHNKFNLGKTKGKTEVWLISSFSEWIIVQFLRQFSYCFLLKLVIYLACARNCTDNESILLNSSSVLLLMFIWKSICVTIKLELECLVLFNVC